MRLFMLCSMVFALSACSADRPLNPSFPLTVREADVAWDDMAANPKPLQRPLLVLSGLYTSRSEARELADKLKSIAGPDARAISVCFTGVYNFDDCAARVIEAVENELPSSNPAFTAEVDVVACSMGGLVARYAAKSPDDDAPPRKRLKIARLFTISTPHRGAKLAVDFPFDRRISDMRRGSHFMAALGGSPTQFELYPYVCLHDEVVGVENSAPRDCTPWWVANPPFMSPHLAANEDLRILVDIARRLRGEEPFTQSPPAPVPKG